jgi:phosphoglycerol transferase MdoB-like AlkP superfamily enzyme
MKKIFFPRIGAFPFNNLLAVLINLAIAYVVYMIARIAFVLENWDLYSAGWDTLSTSDLLSGSLRFDTSAILYTNALWIILMLLPLHIKERPWWHTMCKYIFIVFNSLALFLNLSDAVYSRFTGRRTTATFFSEFSNEGNLSDILFTEILNHWYLLLLFLVLIALLVLFYVKPKNTPINSQNSHISHHKTKYYLTNSLALLIAIPLSIGGMRGGFTTAIRPITISNANQYVNSPTEAAIVLNTPFSLIRTIGKKPFVVPDYMPDSQMDALYTPLHSSNNAILQSGNKNVVILIVESFGREYTGFFNPGQPSLTPFFDSLAAHSLTFQYSFANGRKSIDGMPSILSSIPMFVEPFITTSSSLNDISGIAGLLAPKGYSSAFYHGAENGSMGFQAFARTTGFQHYLGRNEYGADSRFNGDNDFDGTWAIWDEPFLQFFALSLNDLSEPFVSALFTASSHHPFNIPDKYRSRFPEGDLPIHKCIRYTDYALQRFFHTASQQPWYNNTIFVITADHTNASSHDQYRTSLGVFSVPVVFFDPSGSLPRGMQNTVAQQIDILPTLLSLLGYDQPYIAFGKNLLADENWAVNYCNDIYQYVEDSLLLLFDGQQPVALYNYLSDPLQKNNLLDNSEFKIQNSEIIDHLTLRLKAIIQSYMQRMVHNQLVVRPEKK